MKIPAIISVLSLSLLATYVVEPKIPNFNRAIPLEDKAETTANACLGDIDGDGDLDIVLAKGRHWPLPELVLLNDGKGNFSNRYNLSEIADRTYTAALADLDGDGDLDLVVGNDQPDSKLVYFNDGKGHFSPAGKFGEAQWPTRNVTVIDLNRDNRPDILVANRGGSQNRSKNYICLNDGKGHFPTCTVLSSESATTIAVGDINGDGFPDMLIPHRDGGQSYVYINDGKGGFAERHPFGPAKSATRAVAIGDVDGDKRPDIVIGDDNGGALIYFNQGGLKFSDPLPIAEKEDIPYAISIADLNGDRQADIVLGTETTGGIVLLNEANSRRFRLIRFGEKAGAGSGENTDRRGVTPAEAARQGPQGAIYGLAVGDVNGDGSPDIVAARSGAPSMIYLNSLVLKPKRK